MQAKRDRKTLDFISVLTENHHKVNLALLHDLSRLTYIECEEEVRLYMAIPGKLLFTDIGALCSSSYPLVDNRVDYLSSFEAGASLGDM